MEFKTIPMAKKYEISECGKVRNIKTKYTIKQTCGNKKIDVYAKSLKPRVNIRLEHRSKDGVDIAVVDLMSNTYMTKETDGYEVVYKDRDETNVSLSNLIWLTREEESEWYYMDHESMLPVGVTMKNLNDIVYNKNFKLIDVEANIYYRKMLSEVDGYVIDTYGNIFSLYYNRFVKSHMNKKGFYITSLAKEHKTYQIRKSKVVVNNFLCSDIGNKHVKYKDGNSYNCHVSNLKY